MGSYQECVWKHIVDECHSKTCKLYAVRDDPLTEDEYQKANIPCGFVIGKHINHYAKIDSPSGEKYVYYKATPKI